MWVGSRLRFLAPLRIGDVLRKQSTVARIEHKTGRTVDPVLLFRYSALTFNRHRIHYDHPYVKGVEAYPGLIVHGPLTATPLIDLLRREMPEARVTGVAFRNLATLFDTHDFSVHGQPQNDCKTIRLWVQRHDGALAMDATATRA